MHAEMKKNPAREKCVSSITACVLTLAAAGTKKVSTWVLITPTCFSWQSRHRVLGTEAFRAAYLSKFWARSVASYFLEVDVLLVPMF